MGLFDIFSDLKGPVFLKEDSDAEKELEALKSFPETPELEREIRRVEAGIAGEKNIRFELENGHIPCYVLHDLFLEHDGLTAQIDYMIICRKCIYVVECKNLYGNIEIDAQGNFIRTIQYGKVFKKEGLYSPITQNERHIRLIKAQIMDRRSLIHKMLIGSGEDEIWKSIVVLANPHTFLNNKYAKKEVKEKVIRADQLINFIRRTEGASKNLPSTDADMKETAERWLARSKPNPVNYAEKYAQAVRQANEQREKTATLSPAAENETPQAPVCQRCGTVMVKRIAKKGPNAGSEFWGCSNYPNCRNIVPISKP